MSTWFPAPSESTCCQEEAFVHESAYVDEPCQVGHATQIMHFSHVMANSVIGSHCYIGHHVTIASGILMGDYVRVLNNATLNSGGNFRRQSVLRSLDGVYSTQSHSQRCGECVYHSTDIG